jgi:hypothetical protein
MKKIVVMLICLSLVWALPVCGKAFAQDDKAKAEEQIEAVEAVEDSIIAETPIQSPVPLGAQIAEEARVDDQE